MTISHFVLMTAKCKQNNLHRISEDLAVIILGKIRPCALLEQQTTIILMSGGVKGIYVTIQFIK